MQTKKVAMGRNSSKAIGSPKVSRTRNKVPEEDVNNQANKVSQIITSSARKQKPGMSVYFYFLLRKTLFLFFYFGSYIICFDDMCMSILTTSYLFTE